MVETVLLPVLVTKAVARQRERAGTADTPRGTTPTSAPDNPSTKIPRTDRNRGIAAPGLLSSPALALGLTTAAYVALGLREWPQRRTGVLGFAALDRGATRREGASVGHRLGSVAQPAGARHR
jgi:hypothetical protein